MAPKIEIAPHQVVFEKHGTHTAAVTVCIPLYNYERYVAEALDSVAAQTLAPLDLIVVEDRSTDGSLDLALGWCQQNAEHFNGCRVVQHQANSGLSAARNTGFSEARSDYVLPLDADNALYPRCLERCLTALEASGAQFAYPIIEVFGDERRLIGTELWDPALLARGNYIDAMALVRKAAWSAAGGYTPMKYGWEDYDLWCKFHGLGYIGVQVPEILARYRSHGASMLRTVTNTEEHINEIITDMKQRHDWLELRLY